MTAVLSQASGFRVDDYHKLCFNQHTDATNMSLLNGRACGLCNGIDNLMMCNACKAVWYCSRAHQREHYKQHKPFCRDRANALQLIEGGVNVNGVGTDDSKSKSKKSKKRHAKHDPQTNFAMDPQVLDEMMNPPLTSSDDHQIQFQGSGVGIGDSARRRSLNDPDLTTPIDSNHSLLQASSHPRSKTPSLVQICPDSQSLEEGGFSPEWFGDVIKPVMHDLNRYGVCVVDNFLGVERADQILSEVGALHCRGLFRDGQVVAKNVQDQARGRIRGDKITWVTGSESHCEKIGQLVSVVDTLIAKANKHQDGGELNRYNITWRTRAMVACYPGKGTHYVKHVDNPDGDGRCITAIYYLNKDWTPDDGGVLRIYPEGSNQVAEIQPRFDRMLFFWSDRRNPHEVLPANETSRYAITVWYLDQTEREEYLTRVARNPSHT